LSSVLIVEDQPADLHIAVDVVQSLGYSQIEARQTTSAAQTYLEAAMEKRETLPDLIILDLDLGYESGHELLRFWHKNRNLLPVRVVVWTKLGHEQQNICKLFDVDAVVPKDLGADALSAAIKPLTAKAG